MEDVLEQPTSEPLTAEQVVVSPEPTVTPKLTANIVQNNKRLSFIGQIFNWQPTPVSIRITLPIEVSRNMPLFCFRVSPFWIPLNYFMASSTTWNGSRVTAWLNAKSWHFPVGVPVAGNTQYSATPTGINFIEKDNMPDISWLAMNHAGWSGEIDYMYRVISNVTTQGKLSFSRQYNVVTPPAYFDANHFRTPMNTSFNSISSRKKNSFMILDLSRTADMQINCPYVDLKPFKRTVNRLGFPNRVPAAESDSFIVADIVDILDSSAGANEFIMDIWIKAGPDFQLHHPVPPRYDDFMYLPNNGTTPADVPQTFIDNMLNYAPLKFGQTNNVSFLTSDTATLPFDNAT